MNKASIFMTAGWIGLAGIGVTIAGSVIPDGRAIVMAGMAAAVVACWVMLFTRKADEYTQGLWTSAASMAFGTMLIVFLALPFAEGFYDGFTSAHEGLDGKNARQDIPAIATIVFAIAAFYVGLFWKRLRGA
jgi:ABC-type nickel/cobalt efflux system permease component RcnA